jgi:hypothetical protein
MIRFTSGLGFNTSYYANTAYFPPVYKAFIFAITNVSARMSTIFSPLIAEWMSNPSITISIAALIAYLASLGLKDEKSNILPKRKDSSESDSENIV